MRDEEQKGRKGGAHGLKRNPEPDAVIDHVSSLTGAVVLFIKAEMGLGNEDSVGNVVKEVKNRFSRFWIT